MVKKGLFSTAIVTIFLISTFLLIPEVGGAAGTTAVETRLYLHSNPLRLDTLEPQQTTELIGILGAGQSLEYSLTFPLTGDLDIGPMGSEGVPLHLEGVMVNPLSVDLVLTVELYQESGSSTSLLVASGEFDGAAIAGGHFPLNIFRTSMTEGSWMRLVLSLEGGGTLAGFQFSYQSMSGIGSYLSFMSDPMPQDDLWMRMESADGGEIEEILPNGPPETRQVHFKSGIRDLFGAYDVEEVSISMIGVGDAYIFNQSGSPTPGGGQEYTYFNFTQEIEPIPSGTYVISMRAASHSGRVSYFNTTLEVSPGLFLTMPDPDPVQVDAGEQAVFSMNVLNGGSSTDRVSFSGSTSLGWNIVPPEPVDIEPGDSESVEFIVDVPFSASSGHMEEITLEARSRNADRTYSSKGTIEVMEEATFGISMRGPSEKALFSGMSANFTIELTNLMNDTETFELWLDGLPSGWSSVFQAPGGGISGTRYEVVLEGSSSVTIYLDIDVSSSDDGGRYSFNVNCKQVGESEVRSLSIEMLVVDDSHSSFSLSEGTGTETAGRSGYDFPASYKQVSYYLTIYNPTLEDRTVELLADGPDGWGLELDEAPFEIGGGGREDRVLRVSPRQGDAWKDEGYPVEVVAYMGSGLEETLDLTVDLEKVRDVLVEPESNTISGRSGDTIELNFTVSNRGNVGESGIITFGLDDRLVINRTQIDLSLESGQSSDLRCSLKLGSVSEEEILKVTISVEVVDGSTVTGDVQVKVRPVEEDALDMMAYLKWALIGIAVVGLGVGGYLLYTKKFKRPGGAPPSEGQKEEQFNAVSITAEPVRKARPVRPPPNEGVLDEADRLAAQLLGEDEAVQTMKIETVEVVDATILE
ncbi:MAG: hypothetical protein KAH57_07605 [Thermoplasmata archaeon]|nr:hypothetical protein [Thermoplasmata archaeon]